tara:strand:- start:174 stop:551 length:378 start_codon:yes stop_codon:yes gene_type:complete
VSFVRTQVALVLSALLKEVVLLAPLKVVAVGLRATLLKLQAVDLGLWRRQAAQHLRRRLEDIAETKSTDNGALFHRSHVVLRLRHRHLVARRVGQVTVICLPKHGQRTSSATCVHSPLATRLLTL